MSGPMHEAQLLLEGAARRLANYPDRTPSEQQVELSKAISLRRIADAIAGDEHNSGIFHAILDMARDRP